MNTWARKSLKVGVMSAGILLFAGGAAQASDWNSDNADGANSVESLDDLSAVDVPALSGDNTDALVGGLAVTEKKHGADDLSALGMPLNSCGSVARCDGGQGGPNWQGQGGHGQHWQGQGGPHHRHAHGPHRNGHLNLLWVGHGHGPRHHHALRLGLGNKPHTHDHGRHLNAGLGGGHRSGLLWLSDDHIGPRAFGHGHGAPGWVGHGGPGWVNGPGGLGQDCDGPGDVAGVGTGNYARPGFAGDGVGGGFGFNLVDDVFGGPDDDDVDAGPVVDEVPGDVADDLADYGDPARSARPVATGEAPRSGGAVRTGDAADLPALGNLLAADGLTNIGLV